MAHLKPVWIALLVSLSLETAVHAQEAIPGWQKAMNNLSHEYAQCAAYFLVVSVALENSNEPATAKSYSDVSNRALTYASMYGERAGLIPETSTSRFEMEFVQMGKRINNNTSNIAILGNDYADLCQTAMEDMDSRLDFWVSKEVHGQ